MAYLVFAASQANLKKPQEPFFLTTRLTNRKIILIFDQNWTSID
jgi:hypothetical protein